MRKAIPILCTIALSFSLAACGGKEASTDTAKETASTSASVESVTDQADKTVTGKVTEINGSKVKVQLGTLNEMTGGQQGDGQTPPEMPGGQQGQQSSGQTPPEMPNGQQGQQGGGQTPPEMPNGQQGQQGSGQTPPEMPNGQQGQQGDGQTPPEMPNGQQGGQMPGDMNLFTESGETATYDLANAKILVEAGADTKEGSLSDISEGSILVIETDDKGSATAVTVKMSGMSGAPGGFGGSGQVTQGTAATTIDKDSKISSETYTSSGDDENALRIDGATVTLDGVTVEKSGGSSSNSEDGDFYGMNAALLATNGAQVTITNASVSSNAQNGNGVFSYGNGTVVTISDSKIITSADNSGGIQTTGGGTTNASNLTVETSGNSAAAIRSDRGGGTVKVEGGTYTSNGYNSPAVYSTADISVKDAVLTATNSEALVIEGKNSISLENCTVSGNMSDTKGSCSAENVHNVMIYQSMSGDADVGTSSFTMKGGKLINNNGDLFYFTNTAANMILSGVEIENLETDGVLIRIVGNSEARNWGTAGKNGARVTFTADNQNLNGNIVVDSISTLKMTMSGNSTLTGTVNIIENAAKGTAVSDNVVIVIENGSTWNLTGDCVISSLDNKGTINFNGHSITLADGTVLTA